MARAVIHLNLGRSAQTIESGVTTQDFRRHSIAAGAPALRPTSAEAWAGA
jgi:hypothetical protein